MDVTVVLSDLADCFSVGLNDGFGGAGLAFAKGAEGIAGGYIGVDDGGLHVTSVGA